MSDAKSTNPISNPAKPASHHRTANDQDHRDLQDLLYELMSTKARLREYQTQSEAMINSLGEGLIVMDGHGQITTVNKYATDSLGLPEDELLGKWFPGVIVSVDQDAQPIPQLARPIIRALTSGTTVSDHTYYLRKDGTSMPVFVTVSPILIDGKPAGAIEVFRDLTQERKLDIAKNEFVTLASHQLRTPATGVMSILSMLEAGDFGPLTDLQLKYLRKAIASNNRQLRIIEDLLNVARVDAGKMELDFEYTDLIQLIRDITGEHLPTLKERDQTVTLKSSDRCIVLMDPQKIRMVVDNLLSNASKYSRPGQAITVTVRENDERIMFSVKDRGVGMPPDDLSRLFTKFARFENDLSATVGGTGLGLFLVKNIIELHQGSIRVTSKEGKGSIFTVSLPLNRSRS